MYCPTRVPSAIQLPAVLTISSGPVVNAVSVVAVLVKTSPGRLSLVD